MPDSTLSNLQSANPLAGSELFYADDGSNDVKVTAAQIKTFILGAGSVSISSGKTLTVSNSLTLTGVDGKTLALSNNLTFAGTDGSTLNIGTGGTLGTLAFASALTANSTTMASGTDTRVLFDDGGKLGENAGLTFSKVTGTLQITVVAPGSGLNITDGTRTFQFFSSIGANAFQIGTQTNHPFEFFTNNQTSSHRIRTDGILMAGSTYGFGWGSGNTTTSPDTAVMRSSAGLAEVNNGTTGTFRDLQVRDLYTNNASFLIRTKTTITAGAGSSSGTLTNAPVAGNPTKWIGIDDNGTTRYVPAW
jgi:hypothetical protein